MKLSIVLALCCVFFFCQQSLRAEFDCVDISNPEAFPPDCPDPLEEPWCACLETFFSTTEPGAKPTIWQELAYTLEQPTVGYHSVEVSGGTLDLSGVKVGDEIMKFSVEVEVGQPLAFRLDMVGKVVETDGDSVNLEFVILEVNQVTEEVLTYSPIDEEHSFGNLYEGTLTSNGPDNGFTFEYMLHEPVPPSFERALTNGDLDAPTFSIPVRVTLMNATDGLYTNPSCGSVFIESVLEPKVQDPLWFPVEVLSKEFESDVDFGPCTVSGFRRGDADTSGVVDITDAIFTLGFLFSGGPPPSCPDAADTDDNGTIEITDPINELGFLFLGNPAPPPPGPRDCGPDPVDDGLGECVYDKCTP